MANHTPTHTDPDAVNKAIQGWSAFTQYSKYAIIGVVAVLIVMAAFLL